MKKILALMLAFVLAFVAVPAMALTTLEDSIWMQELPNDTVTIPNVHEVLLDGVNGKVIYVVDRGTEISFACPLSKVEITDGAGNLLFSTKTGITSDAVTVTYETGVRQDRSEVFWNDTVSPLKDFPYIKPGLKVRLNKTGDFAVKLTAGFETMEQRIEIQKASSAWENVPVVNLQSIVPEVKPLPAYYTSSKVLVNGKEVAFEAYNIGDNNHFKLRDLAMAFSGTEKQFAVSWNAEAQVIDLASQMPYDPIGGELTVGDGTDKTCIPYRDGIIIGGESLDMQAYNINDYNYFKLRDVCKLFDIYVGWDGATNTISLDTSRSYVEE